MPTNFQFCSFDPPPPRLPGLGIDPPAPVPSLPVSGFGAPLQSFSFRHRAEMDGHALYVVHSMYGNNQPLTLILTLTLTLFSSPLILLTSVVTSVDLSNGRRRRRRRRRRRQSHLSKFCKATID